MVDKNIYIIQGEINIVVGAIKRNARWSTHTPLDEERDPLLHSFSHLKEVLNNVTGFSLSLSFFFFLAAPGAYESPQTRSRIQDTAAAIYAAAMLDP
uniref:Golgi brefeldin A resistant guanine nucleotide exchange factor 1 n=1 Tax=Sus scrofa TaxID=9823 RepID=A0A8D0P3X6_PIG